MQQNISTQELKTHVGEIVDSVRLRGDRYIIQRRGKPVAAIVPLSVHEKDERDRRRFFDFVEKTHAKNRDLDPELIEREIKQAIDDVRAPKRAEAAGGKAVENVRRAKHKRTKRQ